MRSEPEAVLESTLRVEWPRLVASTLRVVGDLGVAADIVQDALLAALDRWPLTGVPDNPAAWLTTVCRNRALNEIRDRTRAHRNVLALRPLVAPATDPATDAAAISDDRLRLIVMCCHPSLPRDAQVALTLRMVAGLTSEQIAKAFHLSVSTLQQRLARAKRTLTAHRVTFATDDPDLPTRLPAVIDVIYLVFNEGYLSAAGSDLTRGGLTAEAYRLATLLTELHPVESEVWALHALLAFQLSRMDTRTDAQGRLLTLDRQDRSRWNQHLIRTGVQSLHRASAGEGGALLIEAELAACHASAPAYEATDWLRILALYDRLLALQQTAVVALNRAVAVAMTHGPDAALRLVDELVAEPSLAASHRVWSVRADLNRRAGKTSVALEDYDRAIALAGNDVERQYLQQARSSLRPD